MIVRLLYRLLLWCHPPLFRRRFSAEMLWIFDESSNGRESWRLLADALLSLWRQWVLRSGAVWRFPVALAGGLLAPLFGLGLLPVVRLASTNVRVHSLGSLMVLTALCAMLVITLTLILSVSWFRFIQKHRA